MNSVLDLTRYSITPYQEFDHNQQTPVAFTSSLYRAINIFLNIFHMCVHRCPSMNAIFDNLFELLEVSSGQSTSKYVKIKIEKKNWFTDLFYVTSGSIFGLSQICSLLLNQVLNLAVTFIIRLNVFDSGFYQGFTPSNPLKWRERGK